MEFDRALKIFKPRYKTSISGLSAACADLDDYPFVWFTADLASLRRFIHFHHDLSTKPRNPSIIYFRNELVRELYREASVKPLANNLVDLRI